ncbi:MAG TPA: hypothetical protein VJT08_18355 [Terriglobales bacterium]|nr:hypothetical protein [Terriglobales bacterium]
MIKAALEVINAMQAAGVIGRYAIGGAVAATFYLEPAATVDLDIFVQLPTAVKGALVSLKPIYDYLEGQGCRSSGEYIVVAEWPVQFLVPASSLELDAVATATRVQVEGTFTWVISAEHLVAIALQTGRIKDYNRILQFLELKKIDHTTLRDVLKRHALIQKWQQFEAQYLRGRH